MLNSSGPVGIFTWPIAVAGQTAVALVLGSLASRIPVTGDDSDDQFRARMGQAKTLLDQSGVRTGSLEFAQATMTVLNRANYQQYIDGAVRGKAA